MLSGTPRLGPKLVALCEDAFFTVASAGRLDVEMLHALAARRHDRSAPPQGMDAWDAWVLSLCAAIAPIAPPRWMPMADAIEAGLSLEHGARGLRSLFTSKPGERDVQRVRALGSLATRALGAVLASAGAFRGDAQALRSAFVASLGLPDADQRALDAEAPRRAEDLETRSDLDQKLARAIVRGAFQAGMQDGLDPREDQAALTIATKLGVNTEDANQARNEAKKIIEGARGLGEAAVDAIRFVLSDEATESERFAIAAARLILPAVYRREAVTQINQGVAVALAHRHEIDRKGREAVLALSWLAALRIDPSFCRRVELAGRHLALAADLGDAASSATVRAALESFLEAELLRG
jgi:hypothetical protein